ncbi:biotin/lipoyl-containing protein [Micromonospora rhizosphaerae]|uniref:biotin/lipoyl-containing protein n=1 Tax=Micromonospora rhizosphaerae TaxID=568872 RepID=UPI000AB999AC|nr:lipoyl domain-containing protein [Micromonospora rhizosphaerae]
MRLLHALWNIGAPLVGLAVMIASAIGARRRHLARAAVDTRPWPSLPDGTTAVEMPPLGKGVTSATVVRLMKHLGDPVQVGDVAAEVSTDKVDTEIPATTAGTVDAVFEGDEVPVGFPLLAVSPSAVLPHLADDPPSA